MKTTRWTSDTCGCVFDLHWDPSIDVSQGGSNIVEVESVKACSTHAHLAQGREHYEAAVATNLAAQATAPT